MKGSVGMEKNLHGLGERMVQAGLINEEQLADALLWQEQENTLLGENSFFILFSPVQARHWGKF